MTECDECGHDPDDYYPSSSYNGPHGVEFARKKIIDLQDALLKHYMRKQELNEVDVTRYQAMVEILRQVIE